MLQRWVLELGSDGSDAATPIQYMQMAVKRAALYGVRGPDLTQIHGLGPSLAQKLVAECGTDLRAWKSATHFTFWLCLAPGNKITGGQVAVFADTPIFKPRRCCA